MRYLIFILLLLPVFCNAQNSGLVIKTGATNQATIQKGATGADSVTLIGVMDTARAKAYLANGANSLRLVGRVVLNSSDSTLYLYNGLGWVMVGIGGTAIDTTGLSDRIAYNLTRIDGLSDTASLQADTLEAHKEWLSSIESEIAGIPIVDSNLFIRYTDTIPSNGIATKDYVNNAIPAASGLQQVLDNGDTSNRDFVINRTSYTGTTKIGDGDGAYIPPNSTRVSFYVSSKTSGQGAGSGVGYGIQAVAEYRDTVGFPSSTTLQGATGTVVASSSTSSGGLHDHDFTNNSASANMSGLVGSALTLDSAYTTSAAAVVGLADALQQSHIRFATNFLSIGTRRRTGTVIDSLAGVFIQQRNKSLGSGTLSQNYAIWIDSMIAGTNNYGIFFKNNPNGGSMATAAGHDFSIKTGVGGATKIHRSLYGYDTASLEGEVYTPNLPRGTQDSIVYVAPDGRHYKGAVPDTIAAGDGIVATKGARTVTLMADTTYLETMFFKNYGNSFGDDFKMGNMTWNQFIYGDGNGDFIFNNGSGPGWMFHFVQNNLDTPLTINTQNETLLGMSGGKVTDRGYYILQANGGVWFEDSVTIDNIPKRATAPDTTVGIVNGVLVAYPTVTGGGSGTVTSFTFTDGNGFDGTVTNSTTTPTLSIDLQADHNFVSDAELTNFTAAYNDKVNSGAFSAGQLTLTQQDAGTVTATINDATTSVKGIASFNASDFDVSSGAVSTDYTNGQAASGSTKGFLTSADWTTFNNKQAALGFTAVPDTRTVNGQALSSNVTLDIDDVAPTQTGNANKILTTDGTNATWQAPAVGVTINTQSSTTYTLLSSDNGKVVEFTNSSAVTVTVPTGLGTSFTCIIRQNGTGDVTLSASGTTIHNANSHTSTRAQYSAFAIISTGTANTFITQGDMD